MTSYGTMRPQDAPRQATGSFGDREVAADVRRIAIFRGLFLGDLLCSIPAFRALRQGFPHAEITLIGLPWARDFAGRLPYLDRFLEFPGFPGIEEVPVDRERTAAFCAAAVAARYDLAIQMHGSGNTSNGFVAALGARRSLGFRDHDDHRLHTTLVYDPDEHEVRRWLRLVAALGIAADDTRIELPSTPAETATARRLLGCGPGPVIALHAGAKQAARRWPAERFALLGDALAARYGARIVLTGSAGEREITAAVAGRMHHPVLDLAGATDLGTFAALLRAVDLLVTNDTGASHLAAATQTPSVVLFGYSHPDQWAPLDRERHRVVDARRWARGDVSDAILTYLPVDAVLAACDAQLASHVDRGNVHGSVSTVENSCAD